MQTEEQIEFHVSLNGLDYNPNLKLGMTCNPFPAIPIYEYDQCGVNDAFRKLGSECLKGPEDIRRILAPVVEGEAGEDFIQGCIDRFVPGKFVTFGVTMPRSNR